MHGFARAIGWMWSLQEKVCNDFLRHSQVTGSRGLHRPMVQDTGHQHLLSHMGSTVKGQFMSLPSIDSRVQASFPSWEIAS